MLKKYLAKFTVDILPSVAATVIGAYIVNHYIISKPGPSAPVAAAVSTVDPKAAPVAAKVDDKADAKAVDAKANDKTADKTPDTSADVSNTRGPGVKAKGISERAILEKAAAEEPQEKREKREKSGENVTDKPAETASIPAEPRRHQPAPREKTAVKAAPVPVPVVSAPAQAAPAEAASASEERRDANDLARAAIDRLRGSHDGSPRSQEAARIPDAARVPEAARIPDAARTPDAPRVVLAPAVRPLPSPVMVSAPARETFDSATGYQEMKPPYAAAARIDDPRRPTPPADIPSSPLDLRAEGSEPLSRTRTTAEDVLSAAKSVFQVVLPK